MIDRLFLDDSMHRLLRFVLCERVHTSQALKRKKTHTRSDRLQTLTQTKPNILFTSLNLRLFGFGKRVDPHKVQGPIPRWAPLQNTRTDFSVSIEVTVKFVLKCIQLSCSKSVSHFNSKNPFHCEWDLTTRTPLSILLVIALLKSVRWLLDHHLWLLLRTSPVDKYLY